MNSKQLILSVLLVLAQATTVLPVLTADTATSSEEQAILKVERETCAAYLHGDAAYLDKLFTDDFTITNGRSETNDKAQEMAEVRDKLVHYTVFENHDQVVRLHGDACVITGQTTVKGSDNSGKEFALEVKFTDVFTKVDGHWRMLASHSSRIPDKKS